MAVDLSAAHKRLGGTGLRSAIEKASFRIMRAAYERHPITPEEAGHLARYFEVAATKSHTSFQIPPTSAIGAMGAILVLGAMGGAYRNRKRGTRARLVREAKRS